MILFFLLANPSLTCGVDVRSFPVAGSIVIFLIGLEMVMGFEFFKSEKDVRAATLVPIAFSTHCRFRNTNYHYIA